jgi:[ribosomal protein S5]-alanine N-acetyltransferase
MTEIETERLTLRRLNPGDATFIRELLNDPSFIQNIGDKKVRTKEDAIAYIQNGPVASYEKFGFGLCAVELRDSGETIGICGLLKRDALPEPDIGFAFLPKFWRKGYAVEAASAVMNCARDQLNLRRVLAITSLNNTGSMRVLEKIGMHFKSTINIAVDEPDVRLYETIH